MPDKWGRPEFNDWMTLANQFTKARQAGIEIKNHNDYNTYATKLKADPNFAFPEGGNATAYDLAKETQMALTNAKWSMDIQSSKMDHYYFAENVRKAETALTMGYKEKALEIYRNEAIKLGLGQGAEGEGGEQRSVDQYREMANTYGANNNLSPEENLDNWMRISLPTKQKARNINDASVAAALQSPLKNSKGEVAYTARLINTKDTGTIETKYWVYDENGVEQELTKAQFAKKGFQTESNRKTDAEIAKTKKYTANIGVGDKTKDANIKEYRKARSELISKMDGLSVDANGQIKAVDQETYDNFLVQDRLLKETYKIDGSGAGSAVKALLDAAKRGTKGKATEDTAQPAPEGEISEGNPTITVPTENQISPSPIGGIGFWGVDKMTEEERAAAEAKAAAKEAERRKAVAQNSRFRRHWGVGQ